VGFLFGADLAKGFAHQNDVDLIARAHQLAMEGFKLTLGRTIIIPSSRQVLVFAGGLSGIDGPL